MLCFYKMKDWAFLGHCPCPQGPSGLSLPPAPGPGGSRVTTTEREGQCSDSLGPAPLWDWTLNCATRDPGGHTGSSDKTTSPPGTLQQQPDFFSKPASILSLDLYNFQFLLQSPPSMQTFHLCISPSYSVPYLKFDCGGFHEQNLYCLGISAVYFGRDISIYISYTQSSIRSHIDFSLQAYIYLMKKLTHASKSCLDISWFPFCLQHLLFFFSQNEAVPRVFWQNIKNSMYADMMFL